MREFKGRLRGRGSDNSRVRPKEKEIGYWDCVLCPFWSSSLKRCIFPAFEGWESLVA